jgi:hypothetical protein
VIEHEHEHGHKTNPSASLTLRSALEKVSGMEFAFSAKWWQWPANGRRSVEASAVRFLEGCCSMAWMVVVLALFIAVLLGIIAGVLLLRQSEHAAAEALHEASIEERALAELRELRQMSELPRGLSRRGLTECFRRLEIILSVYASERFGMIIGERIDRAKLKQLLERFPDDEAELRQLHSLFAALERAQDGERTAEGLHSLTDNAIRLLVERERNTMYG